MSTLVAKPVIKNKFWIVEDSGEKIGTIQAVEQGGVTLVKGNNREMFPSFNLLKRKYNIEITKSERRNTAHSVQEIYGFPIAHKAYNAVFDLSKRIPIFTKSNKSKCFYCAGYYWIDLNDSWTEVFCPKLIAIKRYAYLGPFKSSEELQANKP